MTTYIINNIVSFLHSDSTTNILRILHIISYMKLLRFFRKGIIRDKYIK